MLIEEVVPVVDQAGTMSPKVREGAELIQLRLAEMQRLRFRIRQLAAIPRSQRTSVIAEELSLALFLLCRARFSVERLAGELRWLQQQAGEGVASASRVVAPTAPERVVPATHIAGAQT